ncbi:MAG: hypothetical protein ACP5H0_07865 [Caldisericum sp.]|uniref:hypothetical protein n=1 Tax=Caldisericum sp. TaxID=2499687 RepID=UPI003D0B68F1
MERFSGYLVYGEIRGQGAPFLFAPTFYRCEVVFDGTYYIFYVDEKEFLKSRRLCGQHWVAERDGFDNLQFEGYYWDYMDESELAYIYNQVLGDNESLDDWLREKYEGWGL